MAKLICAAFAIFLLFAFSHARTPSDVPDGLDGVSARTLRLLRLPSERHETENVADTEHGVVDQPEEEKVMEAKFATIMSHEENTADGSMSEDIPLTVFSFESHRQFPRRPFRMGGGGRHGGRVHNCGHHHVQHKRSPRVHPENDETENENNNAQEAVSSQDGDNNEEMVSSSSTFADEIMKMDRRRRGGRSRWTNFRHVGPRFPYEHNDVINSELPHRHSHRHHPSHRHQDESELQNEADEHHEEHKHEHEHKHHEHEHEHEHHNHENEHEHEQGHRDHDHEHEHGHEHEDEHEHEQGHGLFKGIRKFLNGF